MEFFIKVSIKRTLVDEVESKFWDSKTTIILNLISRKRIVGSTSWSAKVRRSHVLFDNKNEVAFKSRSSTSSRILIVKSKLV